MGRLGTKPFTIRTNPQFQRRNSNRAGWKLIFLCAVFFGTLLNTSTPLSIQSKIIGGNPVSDGSGPQAASFTLPDTLNTTNVFKYQTNIQYTTNEDGATGKDSIAYTNQTITPQLDDSLWVQESTDTKDDDLELVINREFTYNINSTTNVPYNQSTTFPGLYSGGWQHLYPAQTPTSDMNNRECAFVFEQYINMDLTFDSLTDLTFGDTTITAQKYTGEKEFTAKFGSG